MTMPEVKSQCEVRKQFTSSVEALIESEKGAYEAAINKGQGKNYKPKEMGKWDGNLFEIEKIGEAFSREEHKIDVQKAVADSKKPGTVGDLVASVKQGDYLAVQERSFRFLNLGRVRATIHAGARHYGHQHAAGLLKKGVMGEVAEVVRRAKDFVRPKK